MAIEGEPRHQELQRATESLSLWLDRLGFDDTADRVTRLLTRQVVEWAMNHGFRCDIETPSIVTRTSRRGYEWPGRLDVTGRHPSGARLAVEVDRANKRRSVEKLAAEADAGAIAIWLRWMGVTAPDLVPDNVGLVRLDSNVARIPGSTIRRYRRAPPSRLPAPQHSPWPSGPATRLTLDFDLPARQRPAARPWDTA